MKSEDEPIGDATAREQKDAIARRIHRARSISDLMTVADIEPRHASKIVYLIEKGRIKHISFNG